MRSGKDSEWVKTSADSLTFCLVNQRTSFGSAKRFPNRVHQQAFFHSLLELHLLFSDNEKHSSAEVAMPAPKIEPRYMAIGRLFHENFIFRVPKYQRGYA